MSLQAIKKQFEDNLISKPDYIVQMHEQHKALFAYAELLPTTDIQKIEITDGKVITTSREHGIRMVCDPHDRRIAPIETLNFGNYEKEDCDMILRLIDPGQTVFDIGGNFGWYSLVIAKVKQGKLFTFEPIPRTHDYLQQNIALNGLDNIRLFNFGFSDQEQQLQFYYYPEGSGNASLADLSGSEGVQSVSCLVRRLDDFVIEQQVGIDFIKCDVEGAELLVFKGGREALKANKPIVFAELLRKWSAKFDYHPNDVLSLFRELGYECFVAKADKLAVFGDVDEETVETNYFFLHKEKHADKIRAFGA